MLAQAELDNLKNAKTKVTTSVATSKSNTRKKDWIKNEFILIK
jgi:hypothetical protein